MEQHKLIRAQALISSGAANQTVAESLGVDTSLISQLLAAGTLLQPTNDRDEKWNSIEDRLLDRVSEIADTVTNPKAAIALLVMANKAVRRGTTNSDIKSDSSTTNIVAINIHERIRTRLAFSTHGNTITQVGDKPMLTADKSQIANMHNEKLAALAVAEHL